jgi:hypothetical protein
MVVGVESNLGLEIITTKQQQNWPRFDSTPTTIEIITTKQQQNWPRVRLCKLQKGCTRLSAASDKVYQLHAHGRWFSPGTPASSTTKTGRHDIAEIFLKVALSTINQINNIKLSQFDWQRNLSIYAINLSRRVSSSCPSCGAYRATLVTNPMISHEWGEVNTGHSLSASILCTMSLDTTLSDNVC